MIGTTRGVPDAELATRVEAVLARQSATSTYWPGDDELRTIAAEPAYRRYPRTRLRMFLEAAEDAARGIAASTASKTSSRVERNSYHIEHVMPSQWKRHWPVEKLIEELDRDAHVHRLGNLTLLTGKVNMSISNGPWLGEKGKWAKLEEHDVFLMNRRLRAVGEHGWNELRIDERGGALVDDLVETWPVPPGHQGVVAHMAPARERSTVTLRDLVAAGLLPVGTTLAARSGVWGQHTAEVIDDGNLLVDGKVFDTPTGGGRQVRQRATNGWTFWHLPDGRPLRELRTEYETSREAP